MQWIVTKVTQEKTRLGGKGYPLGNVQENKFPHPNSGYIHKPEFVLENETQKILWDF